MLTPSVVELFISESFRESDQRNMISNYVQNKQQSAKVYAAVFTVKRSSENDD